MYWGDNGIGIRLWMGGWVQIWIKGRVGGCRTTSRVSLSVDFLPCSQESPVVDAFLLSAVSVCGVFSGEEDTATFKLDVLVSPGIVHALVVKVKAVCQ